MNDGYACKTQFSVKYAPFKMAAQDRTDGVTI